MQRFVTANVMYHLKVCTFGTYSLNYFCKKIQNKYKRIMMYIKYANNYMYFQYKYIPSPPKTKPADDISNFILSVYTIYHIERYP